MVIFDSEELQMGRVWKRRSESPGKFSNFEGGIRRWATTVFGILKQLNMWRFYTSEDIWYINLTTLSLIHHLNDPSLTCTNSWFRA